FRVFPDAVHGEIEGDSGQARCGQLLSCVREKTPVLKSLKSVTDNHDRIGAGSFGETNLPPDHPVFFSYVQCKRFGSQSHMFVRRVLSLHPSLLPVGLLPLSLLMPTLCSPFLLQLNPSVQWDIIVSTSRSGDKVFRIAEAKEGSRCKSGAVP